MAGQQDAATLAAGHDLVKRVAEGVAQPEAAGQVRDFSQVAAEDTGIVGSDKEEGKGGHAGCGKPGENLGSSRVGA
ncbi:MAG: hypothetical protein M5U25_16065 [Planctomycetota bacterium]|nr:hypothetical protein [Planctomycetota bacterium]